MKTANTVK